MGITKKNLLIITILFSFTNLATTGCSQSVISPVKDKSNDTEATTEDDSDNTITVDVTDSTTPSTKETEAVATDLSLSVSLATQNRQVYVDDETDVREVSFTYDGVYAVCSTEESSVDCTDGSFTWETSNLDSTHTITAYDADGNYESTSFIPSEEYSEIEFVSCDIEVTEEDIDSESLPFTYFESLTEITDESDTKVICISNGVTIEASGETEDRIEIQSENITIIARESETVNFINSNNYGTSGTTDEEKEQYNSAFYHYYKNNTRFVGLNIKTTGDYGFAIEARGGVDNSGTLKHSALETEGDYAYALKIYSSYTVEDVTAHTSGYAGRIADARYGSPTVFKDIEATTEGESSVAFFIMNNYDVTMNNVAVESQQSACISHTNYGTVENREMQINNVQLDCAKTGLTNTHSGDGSSILTVINSTITSGGVGLVTQGNSQSIIGNNTFRKNSITGWTSSAIKLITLAKSTGTPSSSTASKCDDDGTHGCNTYISKYSETSDNTFCNEDNGSSSNTFDDVIEVDSDVKEHSTSELSSEYSEFTGDDISIELCSVD